MKILTLANCILFSSFLWSQNYVDLANVYWRCSPQNQLLNQNQKVNFNTYSFDFKAPLVVNDKSTIILGAEVSNNCISSTTANNSLIFTSVVLQTGIEQKWNTKFKTLFMVLPKLSTNFSGGVDSKDFQIGGIILNTLQRNQNFDWRFGAYVNSELFSLMVVPLIGFNWKINNNWRMKTLVPVNFELSRIMNKRWIAGMLFVGANASYRLRQQFNPNSSYPENLNPYLDKADNNLWLYSDIYLTKNCVFNFKAGHSIIRKYRIYDESDKLGLKLGPINVGDNRFDAPLLMQNGWSFEARFIFRMPLEGDK